MFIVFHKALELCVTTVLWTLSLHFGHQSTLKPIPCCYCTQSEFQITISFQILVRSLATFLCTQGKVGEWNTITTTTTTTRTIGKFNKRSYTDMLLLCITNKTTSTTDREHKSFGSGIYIDNIRNSSTFWWFLLNWCHFISFERCFRVKIRISFWIFYILDMI